MDIPKEALLSYLGCPKEGRREEASARLEGQSNVPRLATLWQRIRGTVRNQPRDLEFQAEMEEHVRLLAERYRRQGMTSEAALLAARRQFGNTTLLQEDRRIMQTIPAVDLLRGDLTYAARMLRKLCRLA